MNTTLTSLKAVPEAFTALLEYTIKEGAAAGYLDSLFFSSFQNQLWKLMAELSRKYTSGDSTSLPRQTAESLLLSAYFSLGAALAAIRQSASAITKKNGNATISVEAVPDEADLLKTSCDRLTTRPLAELWAEGQQVLAEQLEKGRRLMAAVKKAPHPVPSIAYEDTVKELGHFFLCYDQRLMACDIPVMIDYQLAFPVPEELVGVQYINSFLRRLLTENLFCRAFHETDQQQLLQSCYGLQYNELISNFFEPVFSNACGLITLGRTPGAGELFLSPQDMEALLHRFRQTPAMIPVAAAQAVVRLCRQFHMTDSFSLSYLKYCGSQLAVRLEQGLKTNSLNGIFTAAKEFRTAAAPAFSYQGPENLPDKQLRQLIDEIKGCRYLSDKMHLIRGTVRNLEDLAEVLEAALFDREPDHFLSTLGEVELAALHQIAAAKAGLTPAGLLKEKETAALPKWVVSLLSLRGKYSRFIEPDRSPFPDS